MLLTNKEELEKAWWIWWKRKEKLEVFESKMISLKHCMISDGRLPPEIERDIKSPEGQKKIQARIDRANRIKFSLIVRITNLTVDPDHRIFEYKPGD